jgi:DNA invertase Pin-like site-specific DNA recombinase
MICPHCKKNTALKASDPVEYRRRKVANALASVAKRKLSGNNTNTGRPRTHDYALIRKLRAGGLSIRATALKAKCSTMAVQRALKEPK